MQKLSLIMLALTGWFSLSVFAAQPYQPLIVNPLTESWRWRHFPQLEGKGVRCLLEDARGQAWFGVDEGVLEYNGYEWKLHNDKNGLSGSPVEQLFEGKNGSIYATTAQGFFVFSGNRWQQIFSLAGSPSISFFKIREMSNGSLMLCTHMGMLEIRKNQLLRVYTSLPNQQALRSVLHPAEWIILPGEVLQNQNFRNISDILEIRPGIVWLSVTQEEKSEMLEFALPQVGKGALHDYQLIRAGRQPFGESAHLLKASDNSIWIINRSTNIGIHRYSDGKWTYLELGELFGGDEYATDILQSPDGAIWVGSLGKLYTYKNGRWAVYKSPEFKIPANHLMLAKSHDQNIWIGGHKSKVFRLDYSSSRWITYKDLNFQSEGGQGGQWFLEVGGRIIHRNGEAWTAYDSSDGLMDAPVRVIVSSRGQIWAAGSHQGVAATACFDKGRWRRQLHPSLSWGIDYRAVFEARDGSLWFGGSVDFFKEKGQLGGVLQLQNPTAPEFKWIHHKYHENGLMQSNAYGIGQSADGRIWIGGGNLYFFDGRSWDRPQEPNLRQFVNIVGSAGNLLLAGSRYYGIFLFDGKTWQKFDTNNGLASNTIISLYADSPGSIWAATENDISHFDGKQWVNHLFPSDMNMSMEGGSLVRSRDGALWINKSSREWKRRAFSHNKMPGEALEGFVAYRYFPDNNPPETVISLYSKEVAPDGNMIASWSGEDYLADTPDERLLYSYRLDQGEWSPFTSETTHSFLKIPSGRHTLEVRTRDLDRNIDSSPASVSFTVQPPVWKQGWFLLLLLTFLITIGIFEYRVITKKQKLERLNHSLNIINNELTSKNEQILRQQEQILTQNQALEHSFANLEEQNQEIQHQRDQLKNMVTQVEELSKSKINFFTNISHELRTPLTLILGPVEQMQSEQVNEPERKRLLEVVSRNGYRLLKLINQLLEMRRIEDNHFDLQLKRGDLAAFLAQVSSLFDNLAREKHIGLSFDSCCREAVGCFDPDIIEKTVSNLLSNAFKHTPAGGRIRVSLQREAPAAEQEEEAFIITVADTGAGIPADKLPHIFDRYYSDTYDQASTGIGLSYIKDLVSAHQGQIEVQSEVGKGATFQIRIPTGLSQSGTALEEAQPKPSLPVWETFSIQEEQAPPEESLPISSKSRLKQRVLLVEDNEDMLEFLSSLLSRKYLILKARNGEEGLQIAKHHTLDLIVSDVMMPVMDGLEFCRLIKQNFETSHIPVILLTAKGMNEHLMEGFETGADDYLVKPFHAPLLEVRIANLLHQREQLRTKFNRDFALGPKEVVLTSPDEALLKRIVEIMEAHISDSEFNVNKMCEMVHLSHMHFIRKVKQLTSKKPIDLLKSYRLKRAKDLLRQNKANISEVAYMVGYDLPNSFSRAFKKEFGLSPTEYLESLGFSSSSGESVGSRKSEIGS